MDQETRDPQGLILLVEDDSNQVLFLQRALRKARITNPLHVVRNGEQAILYLANRSNEAPSLVLLDLRVPRIKGIKVLEWIRGHPETREVPVVVVTSSIDPADRRRADELKVLAYLCKPVCAEGLLELMDTVPWLHLVRE